MKKRNILAVLGAVLIAAVAPMVAEADRPSAPIQMESRVYPMVLPRGGTIPLSAEYFEMRLGLPAGEIAAITIASLPAQGSGRLMLDGVEVQVHDTIFRSELDRLCYVQDEGALAASSGWFSFIPLCRSELNKTEGSTKICATFQLREEDGIGRPIVQDVFCLTEPKTPVSAALAPLEGRVVYTVSQKPLQGRVELTEGRCLYTPNEDASGTDRFVLVALDEQGRVSTPIRVEIAVRTR